MGADLVVKGDLVICDATVAGPGYCSDFARTFSRSVDD
jgi:Xaa-Pro aminopeptidase